MGITTGGKKEENKVLRHLLNKGLITRLVLPFSSWIKTKRF